VVEDSRRSGNLRSNSKKPESVFHAVSPLSVASESISYVINHDIKPSELATLYENSGLVRPKNVVKLSKMISNASLIIAARYNRKLIGIIRAFTDFSHSCFVSDLAVERSFRQLGIEKELLRLTHENLGSEVMILLLASPELDSFYSNIGLERAKHAWILHGKKHYAESKEKMKNQNFDTQRQFMSRSI
jgi:ribosomal protein S18 acetylase RimI-like enzyme